MRSFAPIVGIMHLKKYKIGKMKLRNHPQRVKSLTTNTFTNRMKVFSAIAAVASASKWKKIWNFKWEQETEKLWTFGTVEYRLSKKNLNRCLPVTGKKKDNGCRPNFNSCRVMSSILLTPFLDCLRHEWPCGETRCSNDFFLSRFSSTLRFPEFFSRLIF